MEIKHDWASIEKEFQETVKGVIKSVDSQAKSRAVRASNELRNSALTVLRGRRAGRVYRKPFTKKATYRASAPGEPPAVRTGALRTSWSIRATGDSQGEIKAGINTDIKYAPWLDEGTDDGRIEPRPFKEPIIEDAKPKIKAIYGESYVNK